MALLASHSSLLPHSYIPCTTCTAFCCYCYQLISGWGSGGCWLWGGGEFRDTDTSYIVGARQGSYTAIYTVYEPWVRVVAWSWRVTTLMWCGGESVAFLKHIHHHPYHPYPNRLLRYRRMNVFLVTSTGWAACTATRYLLCLNLQWHVDKVCLYFNVRLSTANVNSKKFDRHYN